MIIQLVTLLFLVRGSTSADIYCDNNCARSGLYCIVNNPYGYTQCDEHGQRFVKSCSPGTVWDHDLGLCTFPPAKQCNCPNPITASQQTTPQSSKKVTEQCLACMCQVETGCDLNYGCSSDGYCGPYKISQPYYIDCEAGGGGYEACTKNKTCAETCIQRYMDRYAQRCVGSSREPTCQDFARIHDVGINGCNDPASLPYWYKIDACLKGTTVKPDSGGDNKVDRKCYDCICKMETGCNAAIGCQPDGRCGPYRISQPYYIDCAVNYPGGYVACTANKTCAEACIQRYADRYLQLCSENKNSHCEDVAHLHEGGPYGCRGADANLFAEKVQKCYTNSFPNFSVMRLPYTILLTAFSVFYNFQLQ